jgi:hypothetical protein
MDLLFRLLFRTALIFAVPVMLLLGALLLMLSQLGRGEG